MSAARKIGSKEAALKVLSQARFERKTKGVALRAVSAAGNIQTYKQEHAPVKKQSKKKRKSTPRSTKIVRSKDVAAFMARPRSKDNPLGGASMEELCEHFGIKEHPMRAKIAFVRHELNLEVELVSRYYNRGAKAAGA